MESKEQNEIWVDLIGYEGIYVISNLGRVKTVIKRGNSVKGRILTPVVTKKGYLRIGLTDEKGIQRRFYIHRLVIESFNKCQEEKMQVNHIDGDKTNNRLSNLEFVTDKENKKHAIKNDLNAKGEQIHTAVFTQEQIEWIRKHYKPGHSKYGARAMARTFGTSHSTIGKVVRNETWKHV